MYSKISLIPLLSFGEFCIHNIIFFSQYGYDSFSNIIKKYSSDKTCIVTVSPSPTILYRFFPLKTITLKAPYSHLLLQQHFREFLIYFKHDFVQVYWLHLTN